MLLKSHFEGEILAMDAHNQDTSFLFSKKGRGGYPGLTFTGVHGQDTSS